MDSEQGSQKNINRLLISRCGAGWKKETDVVSAALEIQKFMEKHFKERKDSGKKTFEMRIGIHTGPVVAGIVGVRKFAGDIWGDAFSIASRMESSGEPGRVNIIGATYVGVKDKFKCMYRGKIQAKYKGMIDLYSEKAVSFKLIRF